MFKQVNWENALLASIKGMVIEMAITQLLMTFNKILHDPQNLPYPERFTIRGLPLITYATRGGGGVNMNAYKCVQGGRGGLNMTKNTHFVRRLIEK